VTRRLATLALIARLDDQRLQRHAAELTPLQERAARLDAEAQELDRRRREEGAVTAIEAMPYMGRFLATLRRERDRIDRDARTVAQAIDGKRAEVLAAWRDLRSKEALQDRIRAKAEAERQRAEQAETDERALQQYARQTRPSLGQAVPD